MDFSTKTYSTSDFTLDDAISVLLMSPFCPPLIKSHYASHTKAAVPGLSYSVALQIFRAETKKQTTGSGHPIAVLKAHVLEKPVAVTPTAVVVATVPLTTLAYQRGYFVDNANANKSRLVAAKAQVADMLAYTYTPPQAIDKSLVCDSNFSSNNTAIGVPHVSGSRTMTDRFKARQSEDNAMLIYSQIQTPDLWVKSLDAVTPILRDLTVQGYSAQQNITLQEKTVVAPKVYTPLPKTCPTAEMAYKVLDRHRVARGEDRKWLSPLTSGYYIGALPRLVEEVWWRLADIMHVAQNIKAGVLMLGTGITKVVAKSLAENGYVVFYYAATPIDSLTKEERDIQLKNILVAKKGACLPYSTLEAASVLERVDLYVDVGLKASATFSNKIITETTDWKRSWHALSASKANWMTWWGVTDAVLAVAKDNKLGVEKSVHAHSGQIIVVRAVAMPAGWTSVAAYTGTAHYSRMVTANIFKTHFPYSKRRFLEVDIAKYNFTNTAIAKIVINMAIERKVKVELQLGDDTLPGQEEELPDLNTAEIVQSLQVRDDVAFAVAQSVPGPAPDFDREQLGAFVAQLETATQDDFGQAADGLGGDEDLALEDDGYGEDQF